MKTVTVHFNTVDFADLAAGNLRRKAGAVRISCRSARRDDDGTVINYPIRPDYLEGSPLQYLNGMPHILGENRVSVSDNEDARSQRAVLTFSVEESQLQIANTIIMQHGGYDVKIR